MKSQFKKSISLVCVLFLIISALSLSACGKESNSIVGTWVGSLKISYDTYADSIAFYKDGSFALTYYDHYGEYEEVIDGTYSIIRDGTAIQFDPTDNWHYSTMISEYKLLSNNRLVLIVNGSEYTLQREK